MGWLKLVEYRVQAWSGFGVVAPGWRAIGYSLADHLP